MKIFAVNMFNMTISSKISTFYCAVYRPNYFYLLYKKDIFLCPETSQTLL